MEVAKSSVVRPTTHLLNSLQASNIILTLAITLGRGTGIAYLSVIKIFLECTERQTSNRTLRTPVTLGTL